MSTLGLPTEALGVLGTKRSPLLLDVPLIEADDIIVGIGIGAAR